MLPLSAAFELAGFLLFFFTVVRHRPAPATGPPRKKDAWMIVVIGSTIAFLATLLVNFGAAVYVTIYGDPPYPSGSTNGFLYFRRGVFWFLRFGASTPAGCRLSLG